jgi:hypothetical protein
MVIAMNSMAVGASGISVRSIASDTTFDTTYYSTINMLYDSSYATINSNEEEFKSSRESVDVFYKNYEILREYATPRIDSLKSYKNSYASSLKFDSLKSKMIDDSISYYEKIYIISNAPTYLRTIKTGDSTLKLYSRISTCEYSPIINIKKYTPARVVNDTSPYRTYNGKMESGEYTKRVKMSDAIYDTIITTTPRKIETTVVEISYNMKLNGNPDIFRNKYVVGTHDTTYEHREYTESKEIVFHYKFGVNITNDIRRITYRVPSAPPVNLMQRSDKSIAGPVIGAIAFFGSLLSVMMITIFATGGEGF